MVMFYPVVEAISWCCSFFVDRLFSMKNVIAKILCSDRIPNLLTGVHFDSPGGDSATPYSDDEVADDWDVADVPVDLNLDV